MTISKKNFWTAGVLGILLGGAFTLSAFTEPTTSPANTTSYPPVNLSNVTQYVDGPLGIGDGKDPADTTKTGLNSFYVTSNLLADASVTRQNANFVGNIEVSDRNVFAGLLRVGQVVVDPNVTNAGYTSSSPKLFFPPGSTTNLISGNFCTTAANTGCPMGSTLYRYDTADNKAVCRYINPVRSPGSIGNCSMPSSNVSLVLTTSRVHDPNFCDGTRYYTASNSSSGYVWFLKGVNDADWTYLGTGNTKNIRVPVNDNATRAKVYDISVRDSSFPSSNASLEIFDLRDANCASQQGGGTTGGTGQ